MNAKPIHNIAQLRKRCDKYLKEGPRHLCAYCCYYREYEPIRRLHQLRNYVDSHNAIYNARINIDGWYTNIELSQGNMKVIFVSSDGKKHDGLAAALKYLKLDKCAIDLVIEKKKRSEKVLETGIFQRTPPTTWQPPESPFGLLEELFWNDPWKLLVCCQFLNQTTRRQVDSVLWKFFELFATPQSLLQASESFVEEIIYPLGLQKKRSRMIFRFSREFLDGEWTCPTELHGIGTYGFDAYRMFYLGIIQKQNPPQDHALRWYHDWILDL